MVATVVATAEPSNNPPRVKLDVSWTGASSVSVVRRDPDGATRAVRQGDPAALTGGLVTIYDYESFFGQVTTYDVIAGTDTITSNEVTLSPDMASDQGWLRHPGSPSLSMLVNLAGDGTPTYPVARSVLRPLGRATPIVVTDGRRKSKSAELLVRTFSLAERQQLLGLIDDSSVLLLDVPPARGWRITHQYMSFGDATATPLVPSNPHTPWDEWSLPYDVVDRPAGGSTSSGAWNLGTALTQYPTIADAKAAFSNLGDYLANRPSGAPGSGGSGTGGTGGTGGVTPPPPVVPDGTATVVTYTYAAAVPTTSVYAVTVNDKVSRVIPTFDNTAVPQPHWGKFTHFSMGGSGSAIVKITTNFDITSVKIRPSIQNITATVTGTRTAQFVLPQPQNLSVEFNSDPLQTDMTKPGSTDQIDPLFIFASPLETKPSKTDPNVYAYFSEGAVYTGSAVVPGNGSTITVPSSGDLLVPTGKTVYIEGGAYFKGRIICGTNSAGTQPHTIAATGITIDGRGVVDATWQSTPGNPVKVYRCDATSVSNIVALGCNKWGFRVFGSGSAANPVTIQNVKVLNWADVSKTGAATPDGMDILCSNYVTVDGCFIRARDDGIAIKNGKTSTDGDWNGNVSNITVKNCVVWNGIAGNALEIGFEIGPQLTSGNNPAAPTVRSISYRNIDVIHKTTPGNTAVEPPARNYRRGFISIHNNDPGGDIQTVRYEDIRAEDVIGDAGQYNEYNDGLIYLRMGGGTRLDDIYFKDISVFRAQAALPWQIRSLIGTAITNVTFENFTINGTVITDATVADANGYRVQNATSVTFKGPQAAGSTGTTLSAVADTWVQNNNTSGGTDGYLKVKNSTGSTLLRKSLLRFDLSSLPGSSTTSAKLRLWKIGNDKGVNTDIGLYQITDDTWTEAGTTYVNQPALGTLIGSTTIGVDQQFYEWDCTAYVSAQMAGDKLVSFGLWDPVAAHDNLITFLSRNAAANQPQLVIA